MNKRCSFGAVEKPYSLYICILLINDKAEYYFVRTICYLLMSGLLGLIY